VVHCNALLSRIQAICMHMCLLRIEPADATSQSLRSMLRGLESSCLHVWSPVPLTSCICPFDQTPACLSALQHTSASRLEAQRVALSPRYANRLRSRMLSLVEPQPIVQTSCATCACIPRLHHPFSSSAKCWMQNTLAPLISSRCAQSGSCTMQAFGAAAASQGSTHQCALAKHPAHRP
jgi:hypothetical protein